MLVNILLITNSILNIFFGLVLGIVCYSSIKRIRDAKKQAKNQIKR
ncbi:MAG TPA: hypothetical protein IAC46_03710 [Candidatus Onthoplasma faecigallinarum]|nr:hypothetical protein [Candidatus Onthoplasma faecigallinarum]